MPQPSAKIMTHMVAGYPDFGTSWEVARALIDGGSAYLEVQFPFSDPSADGVPIQTACTLALKNGFRVEQGFDLIRRMNELTDIPIFIMSYAGIVFAKGVKNFVEKAKERGASGLIIPDLMPGYDENLFEIAGQRGMCVIPVIAPGITAIRLDEILAFESPYLYASLRVGITGSRTQLDDSVHEFIRRLKAKAPNRKILAGFGIQTHDQVKALEGHVHALVVGSALVRAVTHAVSGSIGVYDAVKNKLIELLIG